MVVDAGTRQAPSVPHKGDQVTRELRRQNSPALIGGMVRPETSSDRFRPVHVRPDEAGVQQGDRIPGCTLIWDLRTSLTDNDLREATPDEDDVSQARAMLLPSVQTLLKDFNSRWVMALA